MPVVSKPSTLSAEDINRAKQIGARLRARFAQTLVGQDNLRESLITTLVAGGHILIESVPGLAKTTAAQTLATSVSGSFKRVQCTPDLMPSDLVGTQVFDFATQKFSTQIGPIHANFVLLDEINRSNAKTQSAMLEAMAEGATTIGGQRIALPKPFMVIATQNPIGSVGTQMLPESQLDRFMVRLSMGYPDLQSEVEIIKGRQQSDPLEQVRPVVSAADILAMQRAAEAIYVYDTIYTYIAQLVAAKRSHPLLALGASPRASIALTRASKALALLQGRDYVVPDDVKAVFFDVIEHRLLLSPKAKLSSVTLRSVLENILRQVECPAGRGAKA